MTEPPGRLLSLRDVVQQTSLSKPTIYRRIRAGDFPKSRRISLNRVAWSEREIEAWKLRALTDSPG